MISSCLASSSLESAMMPDPEPRIPDDRAWGLETLGMMAEGVVHDFNNVLAAISGLAELMLQPAAAGAATGSADPGDQGSREFARLILQAAVSGQGLIKDLRSVVRRGRQEKEVLDLHETLGQSLAIVRGALGGSITATLEPASQPLRVLGCRSQLQNAFLNLLLNARDAMPRGGRISLRVQPLSAPEGLGRPTVAVAIRDTGVGMGPEILERIFQPRYTTKGSKGSGLGLANVLRTVRLHQGAIEVASEPGEGTEFRILLPRFG